MRTRICDMLGISVPIIQAGMSIHTAPELVAAVSNAGGLGSLGCWRRSADDIRAHVAHIRATTNRSFALNHVVPALDAEAFAESLALCPTAITFALGDGGDLIDQAHDAGAIVIQQVTTVDQARRAADDGADIIIAQGGEGGGYGGSVSSLVLWPQVIDAVGQIPVVAAGGISDGRGLAVALMLGAEGINVGTRFLASIESSINANYKAAIVEAQSQDAIKVELLNDLRPMPGAFGYGTVLRSLRTSFTDDWQPRREQAARHIDQLREELDASSRAGRAHELFAAAGQSSGAIKDILSVDEIIRSFIVEAHAALKRAGSFRQ